ncbi:hypothetical protein ACI782_16075 [Geodermatophilus sp. SYSU D00703]
MPLPRPPLAVRVVVIGILVVLFVAALVLLVRYGLHRLGQRLRGRTR